MLNHYSVLQASSFLTRTLWKTQQFFVKCFGFLDDLEKKWSHFDFLFLFQLFLGLCRMVIPLEPKAVYCFIDPLYGTAFRFFSVITLPPHRISLYDLRNSCFRRAVTGRSHESLQQHFVCSQDDLASFAKGELPKPHQHHLTAASGFYWTIWMLSWQGVNKADANWSCQQQQERNEAMTAALLQQQQQRQLCNYKMIATWCCCCNMLPTNLCLPAAAGQ